jgi:dTDP-4-amino-4,6-dideoxygalactose transaminase
MKIPFNKPSLMGDELIYMERAIANSHISGDGYFTKKCNNLLEDQLNVPKVLLTTSCTHALEMAALLLDIKPGDEVIIPSFTFVSTVNAFVLRGAKPVFIDIRPDTLNLDESLLEKLITSRTRAIVPVHYAGVGCEMDRILSIAEGYGIPVVEDNAHGLFGKFKGRFLGTFGKLATQSFHETKNFTCGEGGALIINDAKLVDRAEIIREKGTNRSRFFRGQVDKYTWVDIGSSYLPSDILAAILFGQLEKQEIIQEKRKHIWEYYDQNLSEWAEANHVSLPHVPEHCEHTYHMYYMLLPSVESRDQFISSLRYKSIHSVFHYLPLHLSEMGRKFQGDDSCCPVTESVSDRIVRLPFYNTLSLQDQSSIVSEIVDLEF